MATDVASRQFAIRVAHLLRAERARQGISTHRLAEKSGLSQPTISYIERGLRIPSLDTVYRIAAALNLELWRLIKRASKASDAKRG